MSQPLILPVVKGSISAVLLLFVTFRADGQATATEPPTVEAVYKYDTECMRQAVLACMQERDLFREPTKTTFGRSCGELTSVDNPRNPTRCILVDGKKRGEVSPAALCRDIVEVVDPPTKCRYVELTNFGLQRAIHAESSALLLQIKKTCLAAGAKPEECERPASALPLPPAPSAPVSP